MHSHSGRRGEQIIDDERSLRSQHLSFRTKHSVERDSQQITGPDSDDDLIDGHVEATRKFLPEFVARIIRISVGVIELLALP